MLEIIKHTPIWVFILFFFLLFLGLSQTKDREISLKRAMILPFAMLFLSFYGTASAFGLSFDIFSFWFLGLGLGVFINSLLKLPRKLEYLKDEKLFFIKGSFIPLILIMAIFFLKYFVGVVTARELALLHEVAFVLGITISYGLFSGLFFGRVFVLLAKIKAS